MPDADGEATKSADDEQDRDIGEDIATVEPNPVGEQLSQTPVGEQLSQTLVGDLLRVRIQLRQAWVHQLISVMLCLVLLSLSPMLLLLLMISHVMLRSMVVIPPDDLQHAMDGQKRNHMLIDSLVKTHWLWIADANDYDCTIPLMQSMLTHDVT